MRFLFCSDPHGEFELVREYGKNADAVLLLGDQAPARALSEELGEVADRSWFILGNHDTEMPGYFMAHRGDIWSRHLHGRVEDFFGIRVAGLGGVFRGQVWYPKGDDGEMRVRTRKEMIAATPNKKRFVGGLPLKHWSSIFPEDFKNLANEAPVDVLVCHEAPEAHRHGFRAIGDLARALGARVILHGHHHRAVYADEIEGGIKVFGLGRQGFKILDAADIETMPRPKGWKLARRDLLASLRGGTDDRGTELS